MALKQFKIGSQQILADAIASIGGQNLITLYVPTLSASNYQTLFRDTTAAAYQVTSGKTLYLFGAMYTGLGANANAQELGYADNSVNNSASAPTNNKAFTAGNGSLIMAAASATVYQIPLWLGVPATKFPYVRMAATALSMIVFWGFEE